MYDTFAGWILQWNFCKFSWFTIQFSLLTLKVFKYSWPSVNTSSVVTKQHTYGFYGSTWSRSTYWIGFTSEFPPKVIYFTRMDPVFGLCSTTYYIDMNKPWVIYYNLKLQCFWTRLLVSTRTCLLHINKWIVFENVLDYQEIDARTTSPIHILISYRECSL